MQHSLSNATWKKDQNDRRLFFFFFLASSKVLFVPKIFGLWRPWWSLRFVFNSFQIFMFLPFFFLPSSPFGNFADVFISLTAHQVKKVMWLDSSVGGGKKKTGSESIHQARGVAAPFFFFLLNCYSSSSLVFVGFLKKRSVPICVQSYTSNPSGEETKN